MATIKEDYVSFEVAKLLRDKGFDEPCNAYWFHMIDAEPIFNDNMPRQIYNNKSDTIEIISCPTLQMARKWLRIEHNIHIWVEPNHDKEGLYNAHVKVGWWSNNWAGIGYNTDEAACEAAITYCLKLLI